MEIKTLPLSTGARMTAYLADKEVGYQLYRKRPAIIVSPGGGYLFHATREREGIALSFLAKGYQIFTLEYSLAFSSRQAFEEGNGQLDTDNRFPKPLLEAFEAIHLLKENADAYGVDPDRIFLMGFSAGGHLSAAAGTLWHRPEYTSQLPFEPKEDELRVAGMVLGYPMLNVHSEKTVTVNDSAQAMVAPISEFLFQTQEPSQAQLDEWNMVKQVSENTIPTFIWHSTDDDVVDASQSTRFILALQEQNIDCEYHLYSFGKHGLGPANLTYAKNDEAVQPLIAEWITLADEWMRRDK